MTVTISLVNAVMSVPAAYRLYLPEAWAKDRRRCREAGVPKEVKFRTKWEIALEEIDQLLADDLPHAPVVADAGYGTTTEFRDGLTARQLLYAVGISEEVTVWPEGKGAAGASSASAAPFGTPGEALAAQCCAQPGLGTTARARAAGEMLARGPLA